MSKGRVRTESSKADGPTSLPNAASADQLAETREFLWEITQATPATPQCELHALGSLLLSLVDLLRNWQDDAEDHTEDAQPLSAFVDDCLAMIRSPDSDSPAVLQRMRQQMRQAVDRWGEHISLAEETAFDLEMGGVWDDGGDGRLAGDQGDDDALALPNDEELRRILEHLEDAALVTAPEVEAGGAESAHREPAGGGSIGRGAVGAEEAFSLRQTDDHQMNDELREAFLDDAARCVGSMEEALLAYEANSDDRRPLQQVARELHTLKGASGSVGLSELADYLHRIEDGIENAGSGGDQSGAPLPSIESLFQSLDTIQTQIAKISHPRSASSEASQTPLAGGDAAAAASSFSACDSSAGDEESLRIKPSQLNRLMDMLAELVMLRNRRDCELAELKAIHREMLSSVSRLRVMSDRCEADGNSGGSMAGGRLSEGDGPRALPQLSEVASDVLEAAHRLRASYQPVAEGNVAVSQFIRQFRQELVDLRRMPVSGLFRRLQRVASDAARSEGKQVRLRLLGEDAGIERSLQQRLYEPLLHIIRNAVSHGIEPQDLRQRNGKDPVGQITLEARTGPDLLVIEIRDDGRGLDYDALRRRGLERGLLTADKAAHHDELSQLIFHPGFSTRQSTSQVAGRGVGMDVVASTITRMRGWVEIDSVTGTGTTFRLTFPLPSVIQHTMVFRSAGQIFALPMQFVRAAGNAASELPRLRFADWVRPDAPDQASPTQTLVVDCDPSTSDSGPEDQRRFALLADEILGPEEVVVRPLPALLKHHPFCSGATLSGSGEVVLVLDNHRLLEWGVDKDNGSPSNAAQSAADQRLLPSPAAPKVLVVDDSVSARKRVVRTLRRLHVEVFEAADGREACEILKTQSIAAVFSDLEMPQMDGLELLSEIRSERFGSAPAVIIISSRMDDAARARATELGVSDYLSKPVSAAALAAAIEKIPALCGVNESNRFQHHTCGEMQ